MVNPTTRPTVLHPSVRILNVVAFCSCVSLGGEASLLAAVVFIAANYAHAGAAALPRTWRMLRRMRWFFLSILVLFFWFTPGQPLWEVHGQAAWLPTREGVGMGLLRVGSLMAIVFMVSLFLQTTERHALLAGVYRLAAPLTVFGLDRERLAVRIALALEVLEPVQDLALQVRNQVRRPAAREYAAYVGEATGALFVQVIASANAAPLEAHEMSLLRRPAWFEWLVPLGVAAYFVLANWLFSLVSG